MNFETYFSAPDEKGLINEMPYPITFSFDELKRLNTFRKKLNYVSSKLLKIGQGSSRMVFKVDNEKVLKFAKNKKGIAQNIVESDYSLQAMDIIARVFETDEEEYFWVEMELAKKLTPKRFEKLVGMSLQNIGSYLTARWYYMKGETKRPDIPQEVFDHEFYGQLETLMVNYEVVPGDLSRISSYGEVLRNGKQTVVLVDFGLNSSVSYEYYN